MRRSIKRRDTDGSEDATTGLVAPAAVAAAAAVADAVVPVGGGIGMGRRVNESGRGGIQRSASLRRRG